MNTEIEYVEPPRGGPAVEYVGPSHPAPVGLFGSTDPESILEAAQKSATALKRVIDQQQLTVNIQGREHVRVEGWTTLGAMLGVFPIVEWTRPLENGDGWEARVVARTLSGAEVGAAEAMCTRSERTWKGRDEYALRSMAQTRATSKAMRLPLGFVIQLAGYDPTPAEEMTFSPGVTEEVTVPAKRRASAKAPASSYTNEAKLGLLRAVNNSAEMARHLWTQVAANYGLGVDDDCESAGQAQEILTECLRLLREEGTVDRTTYPPSPFDGSTEPFDMPDPEDIQP